MDCSSLLSFSPSWPPLAEGRQDEHNSTRGPGCLFFVFFFARLEGPTSLSVQFGLLNLFLDKFAARRNIQRFEIRRVSFVGLLVAARDMAEGGDLADIADDALKYETYEQYLDSQVCK